MCSTLGEVGDGDCEERDVALTGMVGERCIGEPDAQLGERERRRDRLGQRHRPRHRAESRESNPLGDWSVRRVGWPAALSPRGREEPELGPEQLLGGDASDRR